MVLVIILCYLDTLKIGPRSGALLIIKWCCKKTKQWVWFWATVQPRLLKVSMIFSEDNCQYYFFDVRKWQLKQSEPQGRDVVPGWNVFVCKVLQKTNGLFIIWRMFFRIIQTMWIQYHQFCLCPSLTAFFLSYLIGVLIHILSKWNMYLYMICNGSVFYLQILIYFSQGLQYGIKI